MDTIKVAITLSPYESWYSDVLSSEMAHLGFESFVETGNGFEAYIPEKSYHRQALAELIKSRDESFSVHWKEEKIPAQNWNEVWEKNYFQPLVIKGQVVIRAPFHAKYPECPVEIVIEPNMAFGTGNHETTSLMMETMLEMNLKDKSVVDLGCGTGILAILASKLGADNITAIDIDSWSFDATSQNRAINNTPNVQPVLGDARLIVDQRFDILLVNIQKNVILNDMEKYAKALRPGGTVLFSGFFKSDLSDIRQAAATNGLKFISEKQRNHWIVAVFQRIIGEKCENNKLL
jgi:ribosomal protein L11 methyltransferase